MWPYKGAQITGTVTCSASGTASISPALSNSPFKSLSISIIPIEDPSPYTVTVFHDGEAVETHNFPDPAGRTVCHMAFPNVIFPANIGTNAIPKYFANSQKDYYGVPIRVDIENHVANNRVFFVYACFEMLETASFGEITKL